MKICTTLITVATALILCAAAAAHRPAVRAEKVAMMYQVKGLE